MPLASRLLPPGERIPGRVDFSRLLPPVGDQGSHASGTAWALAYTLLSYEHARERAAANGQSVWQYAGSSTDACSTAAIDRASPAALYRALAPRGTRAGLRDAGIDLLEAGRWLISRGVPACSQVPYEPTGFRLDDSQTGEGGADRTVRFRARKIARVDPRDLADLRARLARGQAIAVGIQVDAEFATLSGGQVYDPLPRGRAGFRGGQTIVLSGYDDTKPGANQQRGAFRFQNSYSRQWGEQGFGWISYRALRRLARTALILSVSVAGPNAALRDDAPTPDLAPAPVSGGMGARIIPAVSELTASRGLFSDRIALSFTPVPGAVLYEISRAWPIELSSNRARPFAVIGYSRSASFVDRVVQPEVAFRYRVRALGVDEASAVPAAAFSAGDGLAREAEGYAVRADRRSRLPLRVVALRGAARALPAGQRRAGIELNWNTSSGADGYRVVRFDPGRDGRGGRWRVLARLQKGTRYLDRRPRADAWNVYRVQAINASGRSEWSQSIQVLLGHRQLAPAPVRSLQASQGRYADRVELSWPAVPGADRYLVYRFRSEEGTPRREGPFIVKQPRYVDQLDESDSGSFFSRDGDSSEFMAYRVIAENAAGYSEASVPAVGYRLRLRRDDDEDALESGPALSVPPQNLRLRQSGGHVLLSWSPVSGAAEYFVLRKRAGETDFGFVQNILSAEDRVAGGVRSLTFKEPFPGEAGEVFLYTIRTRMKGQRGESADARIVAAFANPTREQIRKRFFWSKSGAPFAGTWTALDWDGESGPRTIEMQIKQQGPRFTGSYRLGNNPSRKFSGEYVYGSRVLEAPGFAMRLLGVAERARESLVRVTTRDLSPYDLEIAFERRVGAR